MEQNIHPSAIIAPDAKIGIDVKIGPYCIIEGDVEIGDRTELKVGVVLGKGARIGADCVIFSYAAIATAPQDLKYKDEPTYAIVGDRTTIREYTTINRATTHSYKTIVGSDCLLMAYCHVAHDCIVGNNVIMANVAQLAGHCTVGNFVNMGAFAKMHQFCNIGDQAMVGADLKVVKDIPPFALIGKIPPKIEGINKIGLSRRGFAQETINEIDTLYNDIFFSGFNTSDGIKKYLERGTTINETQSCIDFIKGSKRGCYR